jgi:putative membrane protein
MLTQIIRGLILGLVIVLPGMSGGTVFLMFGMYEQVIRDISKLNLRPYLPLGLSLIIGIYLGGIAFTVFFQNHPDETAVFLLGCLIASVKPVIADCHKPNTKAIVCAVLGLIAGFVMVDEAIGQPVVEMSVNWGLLFVGGLLSSAAMIIPGIPGSSVLMVLGIYDSMLYYVAELHLLNLLVFSAGGILGIMLLANVINNLYMNHRVTISYFFAGLILGSSRALLPRDFEPLLLAFFILGFFFVWQSSKKEQQLENHIEEEQAN